ncbi:hypothetical protein ABZ542_31400, partial [Micromonospora sediminicola]
MRTWGPSVALAAALLLPLSTPPTPAVAAVRPGAAPARRLPAAAPPRPTGPAPATPPPPPARK